jgi:crooked neck
MEVRYGELDRASAIYERLVACHPEPKLFTKWSKFEEDRGKLDRAREIYQMGLEFFGEEEEQLEKAQGLVSNTTRPRREPSCLQCTQYSGFAKLEVRHKEYERARVIYKVGLLPSLSRQLFCSPRSDPKY